MDNQPFDFGNAMSGAAGDITAALAQRKQDQKDAVTAKMKQVMEASSSGSKLAEMLKDNPDAQMHIINSSVIPSLSLLTGTKIPPLTNMEDPKIQSAANTGVDLLNQFHAGKISLTELKMGVAAAMAGTRGAEQRMKPIDEAVQALTPKVTQNVPGPDNSSSTGNANPLTGEFTPLHNTLTGQPTTAPPSTGDPNKARASLESGIARDEKTLQALVNPTKGKAGLPDVNGSLLTRIKNRGGPAKWSDFSDKEQAQIGLAQSTAQRLTANLKSVNSARIAAGLEPMDLQPEVTALADKLTKISGVPQPGAATPVPVASKSSASMVKVQLGSQFGSIPADKLDQFLKDHKTAKRVPTAGGTTAFKDSPYGKN